MNGSEAFVTFALGIVTGAMIVMIGAFIFIPAQKSDEQIICEYNHGKWHEAEEFKDSLCIINGTVFTPKDK